MTGVSFDTGSTTSPGSVMYVPGSSGAAGLLKSKILTVVGVIVVAFTRAYVCARIGPVVENPSSAATPAAAALEQTPCALSVPAANVQAATGVSFPHPAH